MRGGLPLDLDLCQKMQNVFGVKIIQMLAIKPKLD